VYIMSPEVQPDLGYAPKEVDLMGAISAIKRSPWVYHAHAGGCVGCDIELVACLGPRYDLERLGVSLWLRLGMRMCLW
jgi:Ni,Fe-hydrogenase III small subunit